MATGRYAVLRPDGGPVIIKFSTTTPLMAGGDFRVFNKEKKTLLDSWKMTIADNEEEAHSIKILNKDLNMAVMVWQVLVCSKDPAVDKGSVNIDVFQGGKQIKLSLPIESELEEITPCKMRKPLAIDGTLIFIVKT